MKKLLIALSVLLSTASFARSNDIAKWICQYKKITDCRTAKQLIQANLAEDVTLEEFRSVYQFIFYGVKNQTGASQAFSEEGAIDETFEIFYVSEYGIRCRRHSYLRAQALHENLAAFYLRSCLTRPEHQEPVLPEHV